MGGGEFQPLPILLPIVLSRGSIGVARLLSHRDPTGAPLCTLSREERFAVITTMNSDQRAISPVSTGYSSIRLVILSTAAKHAVRKLDGRIIPRSLRPMNLTTPERDDVASHESMSNSAYPLANLAAVPALSVTGYEKIGSTRAVVLFVRLYNRVTAQ